MPLPTLSRTWLHRVNLSCTEDTDTAHRQRLLFEIVQTILGLGTGWTDASGTSITPSSPWETYSSSDAVTVDDTNRWVDLGDLVWAADGIAHSWWVGVHEDFYGVGVPCYILIDCTQGGSHRNATLGIYIAPNPFGEGSTTTRPTAADEVEILPTDGSMTTAPWQGPATADEDHRVGYLHAWLSSDGRCFRFIICRGGVDVALWDLFRDADYETDNWTQPMAFMVASHNADTAIATVANFEAGGLCRWWSRDDRNVEDRFPLMPTVPYVDGDPTTALSAISMSGASGFGAMQLAAVTPAAGLASAPVDLWWGRSAQADAQYGDDRTFTAFSDIVVPWNTSIVSKG